MAKTKDKYDPTTYMKPTAPTDPGNYKSIGEYKSIANNVQPYQVGTYNSKYANQVAQSRDQLTNWKYDPMQDASYQALAKVYGARGNLAAKNTLADAASLNGGYGTSYAVSAAQQARNTYNQELASLIPDLEQAAFNKAQVAYNAWRDADETDYGRFRDTESDRQWKYQMDYQNWRDRESDNQWKYSQRMQDNQFKYQQNYQRYQDALSQYQWAKNYDLDLYQMKHASSGGGGGGGGGRRSGGGGGGGYSGGGSTSSDDAFKQKLAEAFNNATNGGKKKYTTTTDAYGAYYKKQKTSNYK